MFYRTADEWQAKPAVGERHELTLYAVDGSCMRVPDSDENFAHFGKPGGRNGSNDAGYPQVRIACLLNLGTRLLAAAAFGPFATSEHELAKSLWERVPDNSLTILDRGFINFEALTGLAVHGSNRHFLVRMRRNLNYRVCGELPDGSVLAELPRPRTAGKDLPESIVGRIVSYKHPDGEESRLFTTLLDYEKHPGADLVVLYHERWEIELAFDELKTHMLERKEALLRSMKPEGIAQELWGALLLYNLVRHEMIKVASERKLKASRVSFESSLLLMRNFWEVVAWRSRPGNVPRYLVEFRSTLDVLILPARRSKRRYPRHVKIKMTSYSRNRGRRVPESVEQSP